LSPDGRRLAVNVREGDGDIWVYDLDRGVKTRFTFDSAAEALGAWTASGDEIAYASNRGGNFEDLILFAPVDDIGYGTPWPHRLARGLVSQT